MHGFREMLTIRSRSGFVLNRSDRFNKERVYSGGVYPSQNENNFLSDRTVAYFSSLGLDGS